MHLEFVVPGPPISNQSPGASLQAWRATVRAAAQAQWTRPTLNGNLRGIVINFHGGQKPTLDVDNMAKPIFDVMETIVYDDDRKIRQAELAHVEIGSAFVFVGVSQIITTAVQAGRQFVFVRIEDALDPYPLPQQIP